MALPPTTYEPISGTIYQPLSGKPGTTIYQNPPFHPNILNIGGSNASINPGVNSAIGSKGLRRGFIQTANFLPSAGQPAGYRVNFLYNPSTIYESRTLDINNQVLPSYARNPGDPSNYNTALNTTIEFSLLFDRTFELWDSSYIGTQAGTYGVRVDVEAFYNLLGINQPQTSKQTTVNVTNGTSSQATQNNVVQGSMQQRVVTVYFGQSARSVLQYYGFVNEIDITWSHFTVDMVPTRCEIDVTFTAMPQVASTSS